MKAIFDEAKGVYRVDHADGSFDTYTPEQYRALNGVEVVAEEEEGDEEIVIEEEEMVTSTDGEVTVPLSQIQEASEEFDKLPQEEQERIKSEQAELGETGEVVAKVEVDGEEIGAAVVVEEDGEEE